MSSDPQNKLHVMFFPLMAYGHMIPTLDMAKLFSSRGAKSTIITTPLNSKTIQKSIETSKNLNPNLDIGIEIFDFPCVELGLPEGCENFDFFTSINNYDDKYKMVIKFFSSTRYFKEQLEKLLETTRPNCLIADMFFPWATKVAEKFNVPRLVFHGTGYFSLCCGYCFRLQKPQTKEASSEPLVIPDLPGNVVITKEQIIDGDEETEMGKLLIEVRESEVKSSGVIVNSFYELESDYADFYKSFLPKRAWHIGPLSIQNRGFTERGKKSSIDEDECLKWLDSKEQDSVIYISFGSVATFNNEQLIEIALGLEASGTSFIWVVRINSENTGEKEEWLPEGFEDRIKEKGMIIRGWAPQVLILDHQATGGFVTHCGWNSILEGVAAGLPMVTWPVEAEQFYNEQLVTQVLKTGVSVGGTKKHVIRGDFISRENVDRAVREVLDGEEAAEERRRKAKKLAEMAKAAVEDGGSSFNDLNSFMEEFSS